MIISIIDKNKVFICGDTNKFNTIDDVKQNVIYVKFIEDLMRQIESKNGFESYLCPVNQCHIDVCNRVAGLFINCSEYSISD